MLGLSTLEARKRDIENMWDAGQIRKSELLDFVRGLDGTTKTDYHYLVAYVDLYTERAAREESITETKVQPDICECCGQVKPPEPSMAEQIYQALGGNPQGQGLFVSPEQIQWALDEGWIAPGHVLQDYEFRSTGKFVNVQSNGNLGMCWANKETATRIANADSNKKRCYAQIAVEVFVKVPK